MRKRWKMHEVLNLNYFYFLGDAEKAKQKATTDLQTEIKQLYNSINEKDCELAANHAVISVWHN